MFPKLHIREPHHRGFTFVELLVTVAITTLVFGSIFASVQFALKLLGTSKIKTGAIMLATERLEYIRSLSYADIGTQGGIPSGNIRQTATTTLNGALYHERVLIQYVDAEEDGLGASDVNGILADYKQVRVEYAWTTQNGTSSIFLVTNIVPPGIESTDGGGTLTVNVFDAEVLPVSGASVRVYNNTTTTTIDTTRLTNANGVAMFAGAPAAANYQITVTKSDYSSDQTYSATGTNPSPTTPHVAVLESTVSTMNFAIDELSDLRVRTVGPSVDGVFTDDFDDVTLIQSQTDTTVSGGGVVLGGGAGSYVPTGTVLSTSTTPSAITAWDVGTWTATTPLGTSVLVQVYDVDAGGNYTLISDTDLPGNSAGFSGGTVDLSGLSVSTYEGLALSATLTSSDVNQTPVLETWSIQYVVTEPPIGNIPLTLTGSKVIGAGPVYKYVSTTTTNGSGERQLTNLEWDMYTVRLGTTAYDIAEACNNIPYVLAPGVDETLTLTLVPSASHSLRVYVATIDGSPIPGASVTLSRSGFNENETTSSCGQVFFNAGVPPQTDFEVAVTAPGYVSQTITPFEINGATVLTVLMTAS